MTLLPAILLPMALIVTDGLVREFGFNLVFFMVMHWLIWAENTVMASAMESAACKC